MISRRHFLKYSALGSVIPLVGGCDQPYRWRAEAFRKKPMSHVAILEALRYDLSLSEIIAKGVKVCGLEVRGKKIILKPNLVEFDPKGVINTNPLLIEAAIDCFLTLGAREVLVAEGPGHRRDNDYLLTASGIYEVIKEHGVAYVDLNSDDVRPMRLRSSFTRLEQLYLPETLYSADLLVSMPKLKTHHWAGVTLSLKNMFGVMPGSVYGWPKNVLHFAGVQQSILDINATLAMPRFAIVDAIVGMEGNGPLQGQTKDGGMLIFGKDLVAVDATAARLMKIEPKKIKYLAAAGEVLGNGNHEGVEQIGEKLERL